MDTTIGSFSALNDTITQIGNQANQTTDQANTLLQSESMSTENMLTHLQDMYEQQERVSLMSQTIKSLHSMNESVIQAFR